jgi:hypothetical protein
LKNIEVQTDYWCKTEEENLLVVVKTASAEKLSNNKAKLDPFDCSEKPLI